MSLLGAIRLAAITTVLVSASPAEADGPIGDPREQALVAIAAAEKSVTVNPIVALDESKRALALIDRIPVSADRTRLLANAVWLEAQALNRLNRLDEAKNVVTPVLNQIEKLEPGSNIHAELLYTLSSILQKQGDVQESFRTLKRTFSYFEKNDDPKGQAKSLVLMASIYRQAGNYQKSVEYYDQAIDTFSGDRFFQLAVFNNRANAYRDMGMHGRAKDDFEESLKIARQLRNPSLISQVLSNLAYSEIFERKFSESKIHLDESLRMSQNSPDFTERSFILGVYSFYWLSKGDLLKSSDFMDQAFQGVDISRTTPPFKDFHEIASQVYSKLGKYSLALDHLKAFKRLDDQTRELMVNTNSALVAAQFDFANQDLKIARLQADQLKKDAELARSRNRIVLIALGGLALTVGLLGFNFLSLRRSSRQTIKANTQLSQANQALETALKARSEFLATTSHEIRTPLNGILGVTQVLLSDPGLSADVRDRISLMNGAGETMRAMVNDLLDMAKIESGTLTIEKGETDLNGLLDDAVSLWADKAREKDLDLIIDRSGAPGRVLEDGPRLRQIVFNLLSNAIKFTEAGSVRISVGVETAGIGERLILRVTDTGIGIPSDKLDAIFESFQQVDGGVTRRFEGTGLGLSISRRLAEAMGGTLGVESQIGEGSTFTLILPLVRAGAAAAASAGASGGVFLIIEANPLTQSVLKSIVAPLGLPIETAASPEAAAEVLATGHVSALLIDAAALGPDRTARTAAIAGLVAAGARGLAVTWPSPEPEDIEAALAAGAVKVIAKPISAARLTEALKTLLPESA